MPPDMMKERPVNGNKATTTANDAELASNLRQMEVATIRKVLVAVQKHERDRIQEGFNEINFTIGVLNSVLIAYVFGNFPEHFWLLWLIEAFVLIPPKVWSNYKNYEIFY